MCPLAHHPDKLLGFNSKESTMTLRPSSTSHFSFLGFHYLFITNIPCPGSSSVISSLGRSRGPWPAGEWSHLTHPSCKCPADSIGFKLAVEPACTLSTLATFVWMDAWSLAPMIRCWRGISGPRTHRRRSAC